MNRHPQDQAPPAAKVYLPRRDYPLDVIAAFAARWRAAVQEARRTAATANKTTMTQNTHKLSPAATGAQERASEK